MDIIVYFLIIISGHLEFNVKVYYSNVNSENKHSNSMQTVDTNDQQSNEKRQCPVPQHIPKRDY